MTLAIDLGNSAMKVALFEGQQVIAAERFVGPRDPRLLDWLEAFPPADAVGIASVVPGQLTELQLVLDSRSLPAPVLVSTALPLPLRVAYASPERLGADRLAAAVGAWIRFGPSRPLIVLDAGTALTYEAVSAEGVYLGGAIAPGPALLARALHRDTAQLPEVPIEIPPSPIGDQTLTALQSGIVFGFLDGVSGMLARMSAALRPEPFVVATGGWAPWIAGQVAGIHTVRPLLVLEGIRDIVAHEKR